MAEDARIHSINVSGIREVTFYGHIITTGIFKEPVAGLIEVNSLGLKGDTQADLSVHGGFEKAVYFYPHEHYVAWKKVLGMDRLPPGSFGENITSDGLIESRVSVGDVLRIGSAKLQVIQPRSPCYKLQIKFGRPDMVAQFVRMGHPGWYASVIQAGSFAIGDRIDFDSRPNDRISIADIWRYSISEDADEETRERVAQLSLLPRFWKDRITRAA
jgi:MOSC domain-containing protein YiiM